jgi:NAD(P)-dependent dehydrogenase (short-subunit alcohol dehydrogenase family)
MKKVLIIGASSGIGAAVAETLATQGHDLILHGRDSTRLKALEEKVTSLSSLAPSLIEGDVTDWAENLRSIPNIEPVDSIIWSAGICELAAGQMLSLKAVRRTLSINLEAPLVVLSHFYRKRVIKVGGTIVLLGSSSAHDAGEGFSVYAASKGGLASAARVLDKEFQRWDIRVRCIEPGTVNTPMTQRLVEQFGGLKGGYMKKIVEPKPLTTEILRMIRNRNND